MISNAIKNKFLQKPDLNFTPRLCSHLHIHLLGIRQEVVSPKLTGGPQNSAANHSRYSLDIQICADHDFVITVQYTF